MPEAPDLGIVGKIKAFSLFSVVKLCSILVKLVKRKTVTTMF